MQALKEVQPAISPENTTIINWVLCPECKSEVSALPTTICWDCDRRKRDEQEAKRQKEKALVNLLGGQKAMDEFRFDRFEVSRENQAAIEVCKKFDPETDNLYLFGPCGTGKTHIATAVARQWYERGKSMRLHKPADLMRLFRKRDPEDEANEMRRLVKADVLVLDDFGVEKITEFGIAVLYEIVDTRLMNYKNGLIITSNLSLSQLAEKLNDDRIPSRLNAICARVEIKGRDYRDWKSAAAGD